jgi:hypothetical protein
MGVESATDILDFFELDDFADTATYTAGGGGGGGGPGPGGGGGPGPGGGGTSTTIVGIFDEPQASRNATDLMDITIPSPQFVCRTADVPLAADGDEIIIRTIAYTVRVVLTDGTGVSTLILEKV